MFEDNNVYSITLSDGTELVNLKRSADVFISYIIVTDETFKGKLDSVIISHIDEETKKLVEEKLINQNYRIIESDPENFIWKFVLYSIPKEDLRYAQTRSDIEYLAMMSDIEL